ncbi:hypothetical protein N9V90_01570 [Endozoicomonas sp.]|nr:hypothetical protein [Endozoicomonas sp.]
MRPIDNTNDGQAPDIERLVADLVESQLLDQADRDNVCFLPGQTVHPLEYLASLKLPSASDQGQPLCIDRLSEWLAEKSGQPFYRMDSLQIDTAAVTAVMSHAYAKRHDILAVEVTSNHVVVASAQPWDSSWEDNLRHVSRKEIKRVIVGLLQGFPRQGWRSDNLNNT